METPRTALPLVALALLVPLLAFGTRVAMDRRAAESGGCDDLRADFEVLDRATTLVADPILVIGNHRARAWQAPPSVLSDQPLIIRASPRLTLASLNECFPRVVGYYRPTRVVLFADDLMSTPAESDVVAQFEALVRQGNVWDLTAEWLVIGPLHTPAAGSAPTGRGEVVALERWAASREGVRLLDLNPVFDSGLNAPNPDYFWPDGRTLGVDGYRRLAQALQQAVTG